MALVLVNPTNAVWVSLCFFIAGMGVAPALGVLASTLSAGLKPSETAEAYGWSGTGQLMGYSAGAALAGIAIDSVSAESSLFIALVFALATLAVAILSANLSTATGKAK
jgi:predicted MFS family arabinose efflux permease